VSLESHDTLGNDVVLWRRVPPDRVTFDSNQQRRRPSSNAFTDNLRDGSPMSCWEASVVTDPKKLIEGYPGWSVASFTVGQASALGLQVKRTPEHGNGHCDVLGTKTRSIQSSLAKVATWAIDASS
jgi:hypothetical protein